jgi:hypothetical protein
MSVEDSGDDFVVLESGQVYTLTASPALRMRLFDDQRNPMPNAPFCVTFSPDVFVEGDADAEGIAKAELPSFCPVKITVEWGDHPVFEFAFQSEMFPDCGGGDARHVLTARLTNLGYPAEADLDGAVREFQAHYRVDAEPLPIGLVDGALPAASQARLDAVFGSDLDASTTIDATESDDRSDHSDEGLELG